MVTPQDVLQLPNSRGCCLQENTSHANFSFELYFK